MQESTVSALNESQKSRTSTSRGWKDTRVLGSNDTCVGQEQTCLLDKPVILLEASMEETCDVASLCLINHRSNLPQVLAIIVIFVISKIFSKD